jgi:hypothetical protein
MQHSRRRLPLFVAAHRAKIQPPSASPAMLTGGVAAAGAATPALVVAFELTEKGAFLSAESVSMIHQPAKA